MYVSLYASRLKPKLIIKQHEFRKKALCSLWLPPCIMEKRMKDYICIDIETGNSKSVSACALGFVKVVNSEIVETKSFLIKPVGGHAPLQSRVHGITSEDTDDKPDFGELYQEIKEIFQHTVVGHGLFNEQVLNALAKHFGLDLEFDYIDSSALAKKRLPDLSNHKLKTLVEHFDGPAFKDHDVEDDARACAHVFIRLYREDLEENRTMRDDLAEFRGMIKGILADEEVNYKEVYEFLYWLDEHEAIARQYRHIHARAREVLEDDQLDVLEATEMEILFSQALKDIEKA